MVRSAFLLCMFLLLAGSAGPGILTAWAEEPSTLPDLLVVNIEFEVINESACATAVWRAVDITVMVFDLRDGNFTSANVTIYVNGTLLGTAPVVNDFRGWEGVGGAVLPWSTGSLAVGNYTIRAEVNSSVGDADPSNNAAEANFTLGAGPPVLTVDFESDTFTAEPNMMDYPRDIPSFADCNFSVRATNQAGRRLVVELDAAMDNGWEAQLSSTYCYIDPETSSWSKVYVTIPEGTRADRPGTLTLNATFTTGGLTISAIAKATVGIARVSRLFLDSDMPYIECAPGEEVEFAIRLENRGNAPDSFALDIFNTEELRDWHASASLSCRTLENLGPGEAATFKVRFRGSRDWTLWKSEPSVVVIKATSLGAKEANQTSTQWFPIYVYEKGSYPAWYIAYPAAALAILVALAPVIFLLFRQRKRRKEGRTGPIEEPDNAKK